MSNENTTIHEFDMNVIREYFLNTKRQGPGSPEITHKALSFIDGLNEKSKVADVGCGTGGQTMVLAEKLLSEIIGIDMFQGFIDLLNQNAQKLSIHNRVKGVVGNMENLPFQEEELDLIWSEGSIYNIGFERGLNEWRKFLKPGGYVAITENTWFSDERPAEIQEFWQKAYPEIDTIPNKVHQMQKAGYLPVAIFKVPDTCWTDYYSTMEKTQENFLKKYKGNRTAEEFIKYQQYEAALYDKYKNYYGYMFYVGKKL